MFLRIRNYFKKSVFVKSLKVRFFLCILLAGIIPSTVMRYGVLENYMDREVEVRKKDVQSQIQILANHLITYNYLQDTSSDVVNAELEQISNLYDGRILVINENFIIVKDTYSISEGKTMISEEVIKCFKGENSSNHDSTNHYIEMTTPIVDTSITSAGNPKAGTTTQVNTDNEASKEIKGVLLISVSTDSIVMNQEILSRKAAILQIIMTVILFGIAYVFASILMRPFRRVANAIHDVKEGFTDEILDVPNYFETERIIEAYSEVVSRMKVLDDSRQEFVSNVSHELKTPITSMKVLADSLLVQENVPVEIYQEFMEDITNEIDRENTIINDLLSLVKMDKTASDLNISPVNINELLELILKRLTPIANQEQVELILESMRQVEAEVDEVKLTLALSNLIENAVKYNKTGGWVRIFLDADHQFFTVEVSDSGIGIPEESIEHIYERFYRVDKSHSREIGGTGLGLAITRNAILMHRGTIKVTSTEGEGTVFSVKIPLSYMIS